MLLKLVEEGQTQKSFEKKSCKNMEGFDGSDYLLGWGLSMIAVQMALKAAIELNVFNIIANAGPNAQLSCVEIVSKIPTTNPNAAVALDRILRMLTFNSILTASLRPCKDGTTIKQERTYGLTPKSCSLVTDNVEVSSTPAVNFCTERVVVESFYMLKYAVLEADCHPFHKAHGVNVFEYLSKDPRLSREFNEVMTINSKIVLDMVLKAYRGGFEETKEIMDVGGSIGTSVVKLVSVYPHIRGINFDLPHVIADAPEQPGVTHVAGDMFEALPNAETILLKFVLHDWGDDGCKKVLRNCWKALPENGKVIVVEYATPQVLGNDPPSLNATVSDLYMMILNTGGKERTLAEFEHLAKAAGFAQTKVFPIAHGIHVIEFLKSC